MEFQMKFKSKKDTNDLKPKQYDNMYRGIELFIIDEYMQLGF